MLDGAWSLKESEALVDQALDLIDAYESSNHGMFGRWFTTYLRVIFPIHANLQADSRSSTRGIVPCFLLLSY
jgi:hypothetical protein